MSNAGVIMQHAFKIGLINKDCLNYHIKHGCNKVPINLVLVSLKCVVDSRAHAAGHDAVRCVGPVVLVGMWRWPVVQMVNLRQPRRVRVPVHGRRNPNSIHTATIVGKVFVLHQTETVL